MRSNAIVALAALPWIAAIVATPPARLALAPQVVPTFAKDVAPILYKRCAPCHRPGEIGPMPLLTYENARSYASEIVEKVGARQMPPWQANAPAGTFLNERRLPDNERAVLLDWASHGAPLGNAKDAPPLPVFPSGWSIGTPDVVLEMKDRFSVPATGAVAYQYFYIPTNFTEVKWVQAVEVRPGNRGVVHHALAYYRAVPDLQRTPLVQPRHTQPPPTSVHGENPPQALGLQKRLIGTYAPGTNAQILPPGTALRLEPGGIIELEVHYTANGTAATDQTKIGLIFAKTPNPREVLASAFLNASFVLPAGQANILVDTDITFLQDATVWGLFPHTHLRGRRWLYELALPDGTRRTVLDIPNYDCMWQFYYMFTEPLQVPKGARLFATAWYDNSAGNPMNPDPTVDVKWGDQVWDEMQYTGILISPAQPPTSIPRMVFLRGVTF